MVFRLPRLQSMLPIVGKDGKPNLTFMRWINTDFAGAIEAQEAAQAQIIADLQQAQLDIIATQAAQAAIIADLDAEVDRLTSVLAGSTAFTGLNVGGTNVKPFLDNTDGTKIDTASGLGTDVVTTTKVLAGNITPNYYAYTATAVLWTTESTEKTVQTVVVDVVRGDVRITGLVDLISGTLSAASAYGTLRLKRDGTAITNAERVVFAVGGAGTWALPPQVMLDFSDSPGAGSFTYTVTFQPSENMDGQVLRRSLIALPLEG